MIQFLSRKNVRILHPFVEGGLFVGAAWESASDVLFVENELITGAVEDGAADANFRL